MMSMFQWNDNYSVNIGSIDAQHRNLFAIGRELFAAMNAGQGKAVVARTLDRLIQYAAVHFAHEERLMKQHNYEDFAAHKLEHEALTRQVVQFQADFASGRAALSIQLLCFIKDWLEKHINGSDKKYAPALRDKAVA
jgi:hemerythrin